MLQKVKIIFIHLSLIILASTVSCKSEPKKILEEDNNVQEVKLNYATGFSIKKFDTYSVLEIKSPWPKAEKTYKYALVQKNLLSKITFNKNEFDGIIRIPIEKIVVTSTTHIPALELLEVEKTLIGFPGTDYVSSEKTRERIDNGNIRELGKNEGVNTEVLLELKPDIVIGYGVSNTNKTLETINKSGISVIYNGDWV